MYLDGLGDVSFSDILNNVVSQLPALATDVASYKISTDLISRRSPSQAPSMNYSPSLPTAYSPAYSPAFSAPQQSQSNTMLYIALGVAGLLLVLGLTGRKTERGN